MASAAPASPVNRLAMVCALGGGRPVSGPRLANISSRVVPIIIAMPRLAAACAAAPIKRAALAVLPDDDAATLAARVLAEDHRLYPHCLRLLAEGRVRIEGDIARVQAECPGHSLLNPQPYSGG